MQNRRFLEKHRNRPAAKADRERPESKTEPERKRSVAEFLLDTGFAPVVFIGKCVQQFGWAPVAGFLLGATAVYGYAVVKPLPYAKSVSPPVAPIVQPPPQTKIVQLHGRVRDGKGSPVNERFWVGVLAKQLGPVQNVDGTFTLEVPQSSSYDVALWTAESPVNIYNSFPAEQDGSGYRLRDALPFLLGPPATAALENLKPKRGESQTQLARAQIGTH